MGQKRNWGLIFGFGFALLGYCPGTLAGAIGNGYLDAATAGLLGIVVGSGLLAVVYPKLKNGILMKGYFGDITLPRLFKVSNFVTTVVLAVGLTLVLYLIERAGL